MKMTLKLSNFSKEEGTITTYSGTKSNMGILLRI